MKYKFNIKDFIDEYYEPLNIKTLQTILSYITNRYIYNKESSEWVSIMANEFHNIIHDYKPYIEYLRKQKIILIDYSYEVGEHSRRYCFTEYFKEHAKILEILCEKKDESFEDSYLGIDSVIKRKIAKDYNDLLVDMKHVQKKKLFMKDGAPIYDFNSYIHNIANLTKIDKNCSFYKWKTHGRLYTPFCYLSSNIKIENCFFNKNSKLTNLDIRSSFPLFLSLWFIENGVSKDLYELKDFTEGLINGKFYSHLCFKLNKVKDTDLKGTETEKPFYSKEQTKIEFQKWINGINVHKNGKVKNDDINYVFERYYPELLEVVTKNKTQKGIMFHTLSIKESDFIFNIICSRIYNEVPGVKLLTCHDSIYFDNKYSKLIEPIWNEELNKLYEQLNLKDEPEEIDATFVGAEFLFETPNLSKKEYQKNN